MSRPWRIEFKDTVPQFQSSGAFQKRYKHDLTPQGTGIFKNNTARKPVNLWKHIEHTEGTCTFNETVRDILHLRELHKQIDETVLKAYCWEDIDLAHDFYEVHYLPENDRVRYTISSDARKEVLKRLLKLNHEIHEQEVKAGLHTKGKTKKKQKADATEQINLF